jgi:hypothetical protein
MSPFKTDHDFILWKLEKKRELSQKSPRLATEPANVRTKLQSLNNVQFLDTEWQRLVE